MAKKISRIILFILTICSVGLIATFSTIGAFNDKFTIGSEYNDSTHFEFAVNPYDNSYANKQTVDPDRTPPPPPSEYKADSYKDLYTHDKDKAYDFMQSVVQQVRDRIALQVKNRTNTTYNISYSLSSGVVSVDVSGFNPLDSTPDATNISVFERQIMFSNVLTLQSSTTEDPSTDRYLTSYDLKPGTAKIAVANNAVSITIDTLKTLANTNTLAFSKELDNVDVWLGFEDYFQLMKFDDSVNYKPKDSKTPPDYNQWRTAFNTWCGSNSAVCKPYFNIGQIAKITTDDAKKSQITIPFTGQESQAKEIVSLINQQPYQNFRSTFLFDTNISSKFNPNTLRYLAIVALSAIALLAVFFIIYYRFYGLLIILSITLFITLTLWFYNFIKGEIGLDTIAAWIIGVTLIISTQITFIHRIKEEFKRSKSPIKSYNIANKRTFSNILDSNLMVVVFIYTTFLLGIAFTKGFSLFTLIVILVNIICIAFAQASGWLLSRILYRDNQKNVAKFAKLQSEVQEDKKKPKRKINVFNKLFAALTIGFGVVSLSGFGFFAAATTLTTEEKTNSVISNIDDDYSSNYKISFLVNSNAGNIKDPLISSTDLAKMVANDLGLKDVNSILISELFGNNNQINLNLNKNDINFPSNEKANFHISANVSVYVYTVNKEDVSADRVQNMSNDCSIYNTKSSCIFNDILTKKDSSNQSIIYNEDNQGTKINYMIISQNSPDSTNALLINLFFAFGIGILALSLYILIRFGWRLLIGWLLGMIQVVGLLMVLFTIAHFPLGSFFIPILLIAIVSYILVSGVLMFRLKENNRLMNANNNNKFDKVQLKEMINDSINKSIMQVIMILLPIVVLTIAAFIITFVLGSHSIGLAYAGLLLFYVLMFFVTFTTLPIIFYFTENLYRKITVRLEERHKKYLAKKEQEQNDKYIGEDEHIIKGIND